MALVLHPPQKRMLPSPAFGSRLRIDWTHPLTKGLIGCWLPGITRSDSTGKTIIDLTGNCDLTSSISGTLADNSGTMGNEGPAGGRLVPDVAASPIWYSKTQPASYKNWTEISMYYRGVYNGNSSGTGNIPYWIYQSYDDGLTSPYTTFAFGNNAGSGDLTAFGAQFNTGGTNTQVGTVDFATSISSGGLVSGLCTLKVGGNAVTYKNGVQAASGAFGASAPTYGTTPVFGVNGWFGTSPPVTRNAPTLCYIACLWNRELTATEAALIDADPYCFLIPAEGEMPAMSSPAAPSNTGSSYGAPKRGVLRAYSGGLRLAPRTIPRGKVQIDWSHPLVRGLQYFKLAGAFDRAPVHSVFGYDGAFNVLGGTPIQGLGVEGPALTGNNSSIYYSSSNVAPSQTAGTILCRATAGFSPTDGVKHQALSMLDSGFTNFINLVKESNNFWFMGWNGASDTRVTVAATGTYNVGDTFNFGITYDTTGSIGYVKGVQVGTAGAPSTFSLAASQLRFTEWSSGDAGDAVYFLAIWDRKLTASEINVLEADPYGFLMPVEGEMPALVQTGPTRVFILSGTEYTVPSNCALATSVETIGAGGGAGNFDGAGGGGGGYSKITSLSLTPGAAITLQIGAGGAGAVAGTGAFNGSAGTDTWFNGASLGASSVGAKGGGAGLTANNVGGNTPGGAGGAAASGIGTTKSDGGDGGTNAFTGNGGAGGGAAAGPNGVGKAGGTANSGFSGSGGGGADAGSSTAGVATTVGSTSGTDGGVAQDGTAGGAGAAFSSGSTVPGSPGSHGSGGGGGASSTTNGVDAGAGGVGGAGIEWDATHGSGGGGGGGGGRGAGSGYSTGAGGIGGLYGGGGGGAGWISGPDPSGKGGAGAQGIVVLTYTPVTSVLITSGTTFTVPSDCSTATSVECIGGGGNGGTPAGGDDALGGSGGAYSKIAGLTLTPNASVTIQVGGTPGDTWFNGVSLAASSVGAKGGINGGLAGGSNPGPAGGAAASGIGTTKFSGGAGGGSADINNSGGGGGGAAGPNGDGKVGGSGGATNGGGGGGAGNGGSVGTDDPGTSNGGAGGAAFDGTAGGSGGAQGTPGVPGGAGSHGSGGGGGGGELGGTAGGAGGAGGSGIEFDTTHGSGGGGGGGGGISVGGATGGAAGAAGLYGAGGGAGGNGTVKGAGGAGAQGAIFLTYTPSTPAGSSHHGLLLTGVG